MMKVTQRLVAREGRAWTRLTPLFRSYWHSGFLDAEAAEDIGKEIRMVELEKTIVKTHPDLRKLSIEEDTRKLRYLHDQYKNLTGERFDAHSTDEGALSDLEQIEIELRLLSNQILALQSGPNPERGKVQKQISHLKAIVAALHEEYETMRHRTEIEVD